MINLSKKFAAKSVIFVLAGAISGGAYAFSTITSTLTGDPRGTPENLLINVTISETANPDTVSWTVDLDMDTFHSSAKLDEFYFNVVGTSADWTFSNFSPIDWAISSPGTVVGGGAGGATYLFQAMDQNGPPKNDVTNSIDLTFDMTKTSGAAIVEADLLDAPFTFLTGLNASSQLGAHLQSLGPTGADSGFVIGDYEEEDDGGGPPQQVPAPGILILMGTGLLGLSLSRRRGKKPS